MNTTSLNHGAFINRIALGTILLAHGALKIFVFTTPGTVGFFESLGLPAIAAYLTIFGEVVGGTFLQNLVSPAISFVCILIVITINVY